MIIVRMLGGLGNQMFQHAVGTALAQQRQCELRWDLSGYAHPNPQRSFELGAVFGLRTPRADGTALRSVLGWRGHNALKSLFERGRLAWLRPDSYVVEPHYQYWPELLCQPKPVYLDGYWQSERYFQPVANQVREAFTFHLPLSATNQSIADTIMRCRSVSVHVRRGDYITNPATHLAHGCCSLDYYRQAAKRLLDEVKDPHFFVFSDDPSWVRDNIRLPAACTYVDHNQGASSYIDMQLMSMCKHHIIANSSFSWWGAWLGRGPDKRVIAPSRWFGNPVTVTQDLYCPGWIAL